MSAQRATVNDVGDLLHGGGHAIPQAFRGTGRGCDEGLLQLYADSLCSFLKEHEWLYECHITEFFIDRLWRASYRAHPSPCARSARNPHPPGTAWHKQSESHATPSLFNRLPVIRNACLPDLTSAPGPPFRCSLSSPLIPNRTRFPEGWLEAVSRCSFDELNEIPSGRTDPSWPPALTSFVERARLLSMCREPVVIGPGALSPLAPTSPALSAAMAAGVPGKKRHEARRGATVPPCSRASLPSSKPRSSAPIVPSPSVVFIAQSVCFVLLNAALCFLLLAFPRPLHCRSALWGT